MNGRGGRKDGFTLIEILLAGTTYSMIFAVLIGSVIALQQSYTATQDYSEGLNSQTCILGYIGRDARLASSVTITQNSRRLSLTLPDQYAAAAPNRALRTPTVSMTAVNYGGAPVNVDYYINGTNCIREENGVASVIARDVGDFELNFDNSDPGVLTTTITFAPQYQITAKQDVRANTALVNRVTIRNVP